MSVFSEVKNSLTMKQVAEHLGYKVSRLGFVYSPYTDEKTPSCKLYAKSYFDFSAGRGGDLIRFTADVLQVNNFEACRYLADEFDLNVFPLSGFDQAEIAQRERERQAEQAREEQLQAAWREAVDDLKKWESLDKQALDNQIFEPLSDGWCFVMNDLQNIEFKLDVLCTGARVEQEQLLRSSGFYETKD